MLYYSVPNKHSTCKTKDYCITATYKSVCVYLENVQPFRAKIQISIKT